MNAAPQRPCCKVTLDMYGQWQTALRDARAATEHCQEGAADFTPIIDILKRVVQEAPLPVDSGDVIHDVDKILKTTPTTKNKRSVDTDTSTIGQGLSAAGLASFFNKCQQLDTTVNIGRIYEDNMGIADAPIILGLSAAGMSSPFTPEEDMKLLMVRTTGALRCLRRHLLPASTKR